MIYQTDLLTVNDAISVIRQSFDNAARRNRLPSSAVEDAYLKFEQVRFRFSSSYMESRRYGQHEVANDVLSTLLRGLEELVSDEEFQIVCQEISLARPVRVRNDPHHVDLAPLIEKGARIDVLEAIERLIYAIRGGVEVSYEVERRVLDNTAMVRDASRLKSIVPEQKISPVQFDVVSGRLAVRPQSHDVFKGREVLATAALSELIQRGDDLASQLINSNCDRRLVENLERLQSDLKDSDNVIKIGLSCLSCDHLAKKFAAELPDALSALLFAHTAGVNMYLSQFPEWRMFAEASEKTDLSTVDVSSLAKALTDVSERLEEEPDASNADVPKTLKALGELIADPRTAGKNAVLSAARTLENLVIRVFQYGAEYVEKSIAKSVDSLSTATSQVIVAALLSAALVAATNLSAVGGTVDGLGWMQDAITIVSRQLDALRSGR